MKDFRCLIKVLVIKSMQKKKKKVTFGVVPSSNKSEKNCEIDEQCQPHIQVHRLRQSLVNTSLISFQKESAYGIFLKG